MNPHSLRLALGPVLFFWSRDDLLHFYAEAAQWPLDVIYIGEVVCAHRQQMRSDDWIALANDLSDAGKEVVLSSQFLLESETDLRRLRKLVVNGRFHLEANDLGAVRLAQQQGIPFVAGSHLNLYNVDTLAVLHQLGARRWLPPVEMGRDLLASMLTEMQCRGLTLETEVFAWGKLPLALSARCFIARHYNLNKDDCQFRCLDHPDGLTLATREAQDFLTLNGTQTLSHGCQSLLPHLADMRAIGVNLVRISPQWQHTELIVNVFRQAIQGGPSTTDLRKEAAAPMVDGYWRSLAGMVPLEESTHASA
ncbi:MAG: U32 family peptidase [Burkholderiaceae bacterium]